MPYKIHDTVHAGKRAKERGILPEHLVETVNGPGSILKVPPRRGNHGGMIWLFFRSYAGRLLVVVAEVKNNECWLITGYWD